jgi:two-component system sensor histidine kinase/response regulator
MKLSLRGRFAALSLPTACVLAVSLAVGLGVSNQVFLRFDRLLVNLRFTLVAERVERSLDAQEKEYGDAVAGDDAAARTNLAAARADGEKALKDWRGLLEGASDASVNATQHSELDQIEQEYARFDRVGARVLNLADHGRRAEAMQLIEEEMDQLTPGSLRGYIVHFISGEEADLLHEFAALRAQVTGLAVGAGLLLALILIASLFTPWALARWLLRPVGELHAAAGRVAGGDLTARVPVRSADELGRLAAGFNAMTERIDRGHAEMLEAQASLVAARDAAQAASRAKSEFLANMSHEIRTPLNGMLGMTELALDTELTDEQREYLTTAQSSAEGLLQIINDILDFSKIEAGHMELDPQAYDLRSSIEAIGKTLALRAHQKGLELICQVSDAVPEQVVADENRLRQVLVNLAANAIKFTQEGEIVLGIDVESETAEAVTLRFDVLDTGIGIAPEKQGMIFDSFTQADTSTTRRFGGTGLGLAISSRLVALMGGKLGVESAIGRGSRFHFRVTLPRGGAKARPLDHEIKSLLGGLPALIVDDNATNRRILEHMLVRWGADVQGAESGGQGLTAMEVAQRSGRPFALVLLDANMPGMDGFAFAAEVQRRPGAAPPAIMMLSSAHRPGDLARCRELGIAMHLTKPVGSADLRAAIVQVLLAGRARKRAEAGLPATPAAAASITSLVPAGEGEALPPLLILLAEDNPVNQKFAEALLRKLGHHVVLAEDGRAAIAAIARERFDVVLMDVQMPEMGGLEATRRVRDAEAGTGRHLPIVALTARAMKGDRELCLDAGMDSYASKPVTKRDLLAAIALALGTGEEEGSGEGQDKVRGPASAPFNAAELEERFEGSRELIAEVVALFRQDCPVRVAGIRAGCARGEAKSVEHDAHSLKGALGTLSAAPARDLCEAIETAAEEGRLAAVPPLVVRLERELDRLDVALGGLRKDAA